MKELKEVFISVLGEEFVAEMAHRLVVIGLCVLAVFVLLLLILILKSIALRKVRNALRCISGFPDSENSAKFLSAMGKLTALDRRFAKRASHYGEITKTDCREIFNMTVYPSVSLTDEEKQKIRSTMLAIGCTGLHLL